jgi:hypothetical protein
VRTSKKNSRRDIGRAERRRYGAELDQRVRDLSDQERRARLSRAKGWLKYKYESVNTFLLGIFFLLLWGSALFGTIKFWSLSLSFLGKMVDKFGASGVIGGLFLIIVLNFLLSLIGSMICRQFKFEVQHLFKTDDEREIDESSFDER